MQMSNSEILVSYNTAADKKAQIGILADLNLCSKNKIIDILHDCKADVDLRWKTPEKTRQKKQKPEAKSDSSPLKFTPVADIPDLKVLTTMTVDGKPIAGFSVTRFYAPDGTPVGAEKIDLITTKEEEPNA